MLVGAVGIEPTTFGLKGRCSTTELRPYMRLNILHGNKFADLGGIELRGGVPRGAAAAAGQRVATREGAAQRQKARFVSRVSPAREVRANCGGLATPRKPAPGPA
jgi:hypothetical protein